MAEGGFEEYENPEFDRDVYDMTEEELRSLNESQQAIGLKMEDMQHQDRKKLENTRKMVINEKLDSFTDFNKRKGGEPLKPAICICSINKDKRLCIQDLGMVKEVPLEYERGGLVRPYSLSSLEKTYGMAFIQETLGFVDYKQPPKVSQAEIAALTRMRDKLILQQKKYQCKTLPKLQKLKQQLMQQMKLKHLFVSQNFQMMHKQKV